MRKLRVATVFIASPSDVEDERRAVRRAIERANAVVAERLGVCLEPFGWEQLPPGTSARPQDLINVHVDKAEAFVGILNQKFGAPNGVSESGTLEEFQRAHDRARSGRTFPFPEVGVFFRDLPEAVTGSPGPEVRRVLTFKSTIQPTAMYRRFTDTVDFENRVLEFLAAAIWKWQDTGRIGTLPMADAPSSGELALLLCSLAESHGLPEAGLPGSPSGEFVERLLEQGLVRRDAGTGHLALPDAAESLPRVASLVLDTEHATRFLKSDYYSRHVTTSIPQLFESRFHAPVPPERLRTLTALVQCSPSAAAYVLYGDAQPYDNMLAQLDRMKPVDADAETWRAQIPDLVLQRLLVRYVADASGARTSDRALDRTVCGQVLRLSAAIGFEDHSPPVRAETVISILRVRAGCEIKAGELAFAPPGHFANAAIAFLDMHENELAISTLREALDHPVDPGARQAILANLGLAHLRAGRPHEAAVQLRASLDIGVNPEATRVATANLALVADAMRRPGGGSKER